MRANISFLATVFTALIFLSCGNDEKIHQSELTVKDFFKSINQEEEDSMKVYYPRISTFDNYFKSDSITIKSSKLLNDSIVSVLATNYFTNGFGKESVNEIELFVTSDSLKKFSKIIDSKGLTDYKDNNLYDFAQKTGCLKKSDTTDVLKNQQLLEAYVLAYSYTLDKMIELKMDVNVVDWRWEKGYGNSASGKAIVQNNSVYSIPNVKYEITYYDRAGNKITSDDGYVNYDVLGAGESKSFTFYTSYVGNASKANISLEFDEDLVNDFVLKNEYNGDEYSVYLAEKENRSDIMSSN